MRILGEDIDFRREIAARSQHADRLEAALDETFSGVLPAEVAKELSLAMGVTLGELMLELTRYAATCARPPISDYRVGAVARGDSGALYFGANIEFLEESLSFTIHAEQAATANALLHGETGLVSLAVNSIPCGSCRQFLYEINTSSTLVIITRDSIRLLTDLLPEPFGPKEMARDTALMEPQGHDLKWIDSGDRPEDDPVVRAALEQARAAYAPYTGGYSGVALATSDGEIYRGSYAESAAFNPSVFPIGAALVDFIFSGKRYSEIERAVLVEPEASPSSQKDVTRDVLTAISKHSEGSRRRSVDFEVRHVKLASSSPRTPRQQNLFSQPAAGEADTA